MSATTLVVGAGGLLGRHVLEAVRRGGGTVATAEVPWDDAAAARAALRDQVRRLIAEHRSWNVAWCAGAGVVATPAEVLEAELAFFRDFLDDLVAEAGGSAARPDGAFFLASSAGGLYAGSRGAPFTEETQPAPLAPYGEVKLAMEQALRAAAARLGIPVLVGRLANLYGPGQDLGKGQGLVSRVCQAHLTRQALEVYGSPDTMRDYLYVGDAAAMVAAGLDGLRERSSATGGFWQVKVMCSGQGTTIAGMIGESNRVFHRRAPVVMRGGAPGQIRDLRLRSVAWPELQRHVRTGLAVGLHHTAADVARRVMLRDRADRL